MVLPAFFLTFNCPLLTFYYFTFYHTILYLCIKKELLPYEFSSTESSSCPSLQTYADSCGQQLFFILLSYYILYSYMISFAISSTISSRLSDTPHTRSPQSPLP